MSVKQIPNLPSAVGLSSTDLFEGVQAGTSRQISLGDIAAYVNSTYPAPGIASVSGSTPISVSTVGSAATVSLDLQGVTNAYMATMPAGTVKANVTVGSASPTDATVSQVLDTFGSTKGMMLYRDTTSWVALTSGTAGQVLTAQGTTAAPIWSNLSITPGSLTPTGVSAGTYGSASTVPQFTVLASGQLSAASNVPITIPSTSVTGLGTMATQNANTVAITGGNIDSTTIGASTPAAGSFTTLTSTSSTNLGTIQSGTWNGTPIAVLYGGTGATTASGARANLGAASSGANSDITSLSGLTTPLSAPQGGTGFGSYTTGDILYADSSSTLARLNDVATGNALISGGNGVAPLWGKIGLTTHVSGTLPVANGGSGATTLTGFLKGNGTSAFTAQATIGNADLTNSSITVGSTSIALGGTSTTLAGLTTVTLTQDPTLALQAATKQYVDNEVLAVSNTTFHASSDYATTADLGSVTYSNGAGGVGATITQSGAPSVLIIDGYTFTAADVINATRVLVKDQSSGLQNGIYTVANEGSGAANWQLIRATDFDATGTGPDNIQTGASTFVTGGAANGSTGWIMNTTGTIIVGTTALVWVQSSSSAGVTVTSPLQKVGSVISLTTVPVNLGGTNLTSYTQYELLYAPTSGSIGQISSGTAGYPLISGGAGAAPAFNQLSLSGSGVTGTLPVGNGGTGTTTAFTAGSVVFAGASGVYSQENAEFFWDNTNDFLGLGTAVPDTRLTITAPTQTSVTAGTLPAGTDLHIVGADSAITRITQDAFGTGNYPAYTGRAARGTAAAPTASQAGDILSQYGGRGHGATAYSSTSVGRIDVEAAENFTDTAQGSYISLHTTATGTASPNERFRAGPAGQWGIGGANYGTSGQVFTSGGASAAPTWSDISVTTVTGTLPVANGGTGLTSYTIGDLIYADGATSLAKLADVATGNALISGGIGVAPSWGKIGLSTHVSGTLPIGSGGTGLTGTPTNGQLLIGNGTGYSLGTLTAGSANLTVTNGSGTITLDINSSPTLTGLTVNGSAVISTSSSSDALRITQTGTGNALLVEDSANPDATPFVVDASGRVLVGSTAAFAGSNGVTAQVQVHGSTNNNQAALNINDWQTGGFQGPFLQLNKSKGGAVGTQGAVASGDRLGYFTFSGDDGTAFIPAARIESSVDGTPGTNDMPGRLVFSTTADGASTPTERMRIDSAGQVGIGGAPGSGQSLTLSKTLTGSTSTIGIQNAGVVQSDSTGSAVYFRAAPATAAATFTVTNIYSYVASQGTFGAGSTVTNQFGYWANGNLTGATNNYGFHSNLAAGTGRWNFYAAGTADNYFAGQVQLAAGTVSAPALSTTGDTNTGIFFPAADTIAFSEGGVESMRITSTGDVGIGTSSPATKLHLLTASATSVALRVGNSVSYAELQIDASGNSQLIAPSGVQIFNTNGAERMRIDSVGNVGIGLTPNAGQGVLQTFRNISGGAPVTSGTNDPNQAAMLGAGSVQLSYGAYPAGTGWLQMRATGNFATNYDLVLQPNGGNVGIGTSSPGEKLQVEGNIYLGTTSRAVYQGGSANLTLQTNTGSIIFATNLGTQRAAITSAGGFMVGTTTDPGAGYISDVSGNVRSIPQNAQTTGYTLVVGDNGKHISITTGGVTVPSAVFSAGMNIVIFNNSGSSQTITQGASVTLRLAGTATTGNRTLAQYGVATILCVASNTFVISGSGLT